MRKGISYQLLETSPRLTPALSFSEFVRRLTPEVGSPEPEIFLALLHRLRGALVHEMKKRGLWEASPRFLGVYGNSRWEDDPLEDLLLSCYEFIFIRRLPGLVNHLEAGGNVDGLVFLDIRHFLHETQRRHDPLGYRIFDLLRGAIQKLVTAKNLHVIDGDPRLRNHTLLAFSPWCLPEEAQELDLQPQTAVWNETLLPDLVTAWNREGITRNLTEHICSLEREGIPCFRFGDLLTPLKADVRARWLAIGVAGVKADELDALSSDEHWMRPNMGFEDRRRFDRLLQCTSEGLDRLRQGDRAKDYLRRLFLFLQSWAAEESSVSKASTEQPLTTQLGTMQMPDNLPSDKRLGELLSIPRARIPGLKATLGDLLRHCRDRLDQPASALSFPAHHSPQDRREHLREATARAISELPTKPPRGNEPPRPGDLYLHLPDVYPGKWAAVEVEGETIQVVSVDELPLVGSRDIALKGARPRQILRGDSSAWVSSETLADGYFIGELESDLLEEIRRHLRHLSDAPTEPIDDIDQSEIYREWLDRIKESRRELGPIEPRATQPISGRQKPDLSARQSPWPMALAATIAAASLSLALWVARDRQRPEPRVFRSASSTDLRFLDVKRGNGVIEIQAAGEDTLIYLDLSRVPEYTHYRLEILDPARNKALWSQDHISADREMVLGIPNGSIPEGKYRLRILGEEVGGDTTKLAEEMLQINYSSTEPP